MKIKQKLSRREFIFYLLTFSIFTLIVSKNEDKEEFYIDEYTNKKIKKYNSMRTISSKKELEFAIESDHKNNKTIWVGKKLYTFAEIP